MTSDQERIAKLTSAVMRMGLIQGGLRDFAARIISRSRRGTPPSLKVLYEIRAICLRNAKNATVSGLPIKDEADMLREAIDDLDKLMQGAIAKGWQGE